MNATYNNIYNTNGYSFTSCKWNHIAAFARKRLR